MKTNFQFKPALKKDIKEITKDDIRVQILGTVIEYIPGTINDSGSLSQMILSDGTGNLNVLIDENLDREFKIGDKVRVFGSLIHDAESDTKLYAEIIQDMNKLNIELYKKVEELKKKL